MTEIFTFEDDEKFCIFVTKDKRQALILTMYYTVYLQVLTAKAVWIFSSMIVFCF